jgi:hypothetical protein
MTTEQDVNLYRLRGIDTIILEGTKATDVSDADLSLMVKDRANLQELLTKRYRVSRYNNKATTVTNLTYIAVGVLTYPDDEKPLGWHKYALRLIDDVLKSPNTTEQNAYEISASSYLAQNLTFVQHDVYDSIRLSFKGVTPFPKIV